MNSYTLETIELIEKEAELTARLAAGGGPGHRAEAQESHAEQLKGAHLCSSSDSPEVQMQAVVLFIHGVHHRYTQSPAAQTSRRTLRMTRS